MVTEGKAIVSILIMPEAFVGILSVKCLVLYKQKDVFCRGYSHVANVNLPCRCILHNYIQI